MVMSADPVYFVKQPLNLPKNTPPGVAWKFERALYLVQHELSDAIATWHEKAKPYSFDPEERGEDLLVRLRIRMNVPPHFGVMAGDSLHNLRSALNILWKAALTGAVRREDFPISSDGEALESRLQKLLRRGYAQPDVLQIIRDLKPYRGGNETLWKLSELNNLDKHQALLVVRGGLRFVRLAIGGVKFDSHGHFVEDASVHGEVRSVRPQGYKPGRTSISLTDGQIVLRLPKSLHVRLDRDPIYAVDEAFGDPPVAGEPLVETLYDFCRAVQETICAFMELPVFHK
jgi:hypothetical protein